MKALEYPFNPEYIIKNKKRIKRELLEHTNATFLEKKIAILGGETTSDIKLVLELFLLNYGIKPIFYESEYNQYYEDGMFSNPCLEAFKPDIIFICTCIRNINLFPEISDTREEVLCKKQCIMDRFVGLWGAIKERYHCPIIQNNFEYPFYRLMGNKDASDYRGKVNFVTQLNIDFYNYAQSNNDFYICDINYISSSYGLEKWAEPYYWYMYKYAVSVPAIPYLSFNVANIIKSIYGKNKKAFNLDLDNTLWGGVIGDDGKENIELGQETSVGQAYSEFQQYILEHKQMGILLSVNSKNNLEMALSGFQRPDTVLTKDDFFDFKANWNLKNENLESTACKMNLLPESFVFVDDNPAERKIIHDSFFGVGIPELKNVEHYIQMIDKSGYFEVTVLSRDDLDRNKMVQEEIKRTNLQNKFTDYNSYLKSLEMHGEIKAFKSIYLSRIAQLTNKSNQFNLTSKRYSPSEIEAIANNPVYITLYGKLGDKFGDMGIVSVLIGRVDSINKEELHLDLWLMSCRVLRRNMEFAMMDKLVEEAKLREIKKIIGYYYPTLKNRMVKDFYALQGFHKIKEDKEGNTVWEFLIDDSYQNKQDTISVI